MNYKHTQIEDSRSGWLITYGDLMTLMLTFFVLLYSMSSIDPIKLSMIIEQENSGVAKYYSMPVIEDEFKKIIKKTKLTQSAQISKDKRGIAVELKGDVSFLSGSSTINQKLDQFLDELIIKLLNNPKDKRTIIVEGHTDNQSITKELKKKYPTNWELSAARASSVVNRIIQKSIIFAKEGKINSIYKDGRISSRLVASGYADQWPTNISYGQRKQGQINTKIIEENNKTNKLKKKNRRIKIIYTIN